MSHQGKIGIVRAFLLFFLWAVAIVNPNVHVNASLFFVLVEEVQFKTSMAKPLQINLALDGFVGKRTLIDLLLHFLSLLKSCHLLRSKVLGHSSGGTWLTSSRRSLLLVIVSSIQLSCEIVKIRHRLQFI